MSQNEQINASRIAEAALAQELARIRQEQLKAEISQDLEACNRYVAENGSFADMVSAHYGEPEAQFDVFENPISRVRPCPGPWGA